MGAVMIYRIENRFVMRLEQFVCPVRFQPKFRIQVYFRTVSGTLLVAPSRFRPGLLLGRIPELFSLAVHISDYPPLLTAKGFRLSDFKGCRFRFRHIKENRLFDVKI